ncbi:hypothetical protein, conserved [Eimeria acervulina]|uniref:Uncharacterized protein n=1 Tax=Eimeria acervulina TaxID=5801 RepID=U6G8P6_EIMAC|nr:hypothetical protein, conserved [Eimeria acervulina]CDI76611.1 hypothetical protein, conserved [Eimeria acervulina]
MSRPQALLSSFLCSTSRYAGRVLRLPLQLLQLQLVLLLLVAPQQQHAAAQGLEPLNAGPHGSTDSVMSLQEGFSGRSPGIVSSKVGSPGPGGSLPEGWSPDETEAAAAAAAAASAAAGAAAAGAAAASAFTQPDLDNPHKLPQQLPAASRYRELLFDLGEDSTEAYATSTAAKLQKEQMARAARNRRWTLGLFLLGAFLIFGVLSVRHNARKRHLLKRLRRMEVLDSEAEQLAEALGTEESRVQGDVVHKALQEAQRSREVMQQKQHQRPMHAAWACKTEHEALNTIEGMLQEALSSLRSLDGAARQALQDAQMNMPAGDVSTQWAEDTEKNLEDLVGKDYAESLLRLLTLLQEDVSGLQATATQVMEHSKETQPFVNEKDGLQLKRTRMQLQYVGSVGGAISVDNETASQLQAQTQSALRQVLRQELERHMQVAAYAVDQMDAMLEMYTGEGWGSSPLRPGLRVQAQQHLKTAKQFQAQLEEESEELQRVESAEDISSLYARADETYQEIERALKRCEDILKTLPPPPLLVLVQEELVGVAKKHVGGVQRIAASVREIVKAVESEVRLGVKVDTSVRLSGRRPYTCSGAVNNLLKDLKQAAEEVDRSCSACEAAVKAITQRQSVAEVQRAAAEVKQAIAEAAGARCSVEHFLTKFSLLYALDASIADSAQAANLFKSDAALPPKEGSSAGEAQSKANSPAKGRAPSASVLEKIQKMRDAFDLELAFVEEAATLGEVAEAASRMRRSARKIVYMAYSYGSGIAEKEGEKPKRPPAKGRRRQRRNKKAKGETRAKAEEDTVDSPHANEERIHFRAGTYEDGDGTTDDDDAYDEEDYDASGESDTDEESEQQDFPESPDAGEESLDPWGAIAGGIHEAGDPGAPAASEDDKSSDRGAAEPAYAPGAAGDPKESDPVLESGGPIGGARDPSEETTVRVVEVGDSAGELDAPFGEMGGPVEGVGVPVGEVGDPAGAVGEPAGDTTDVSERRDALAGSTGGSGETGGPTGGTADPAGETGDPAGETDGPAGGTGDPTGETGDPAGETGDPAGESRDPAGETRDPVGETGDAAGETGDPAGETRDPAEMGEQVGETGDPAGETGDPAGETGDPAGETGDPAEETGDPAGEMGDPAGETGDPAGETGDPAGATGYPGGESAGETGYPAGQTDNPAEGVGNLAGSVRGLPGEAGGLPGAMGDPSGAAGDTAGVPPEETTGPVLAVGDPETSDPSEETTDPVVEADSPDEKASERNEEMSDPSGETSKPNEEPTDLETVDTDGEAGGPAEETGDRVGETDGHVEEADGPAGELGGPAGAMREPVESNGERVGGMGDSEETDDPGAGIDDRTE